MELHCPQCQHVLDQDNGHARCPSCGAVDYFCQHGHGLISKKRVEFVLA